MNKAIEAKQHPLPPSPTSIPEVLATYLRSVNKSWSWQEAGIESLSMLWGQGMEPLTEDLLTDAPEEVREAVLTGTVGQRRLFRNPDGYFQSYDGVLCIQDSELRDQQEAAWMSRRDSIESGESWIEDLESKLQQLGRQAGRTSSDPLLTGEMEAATAAVKVSKELRGVSIKK